jgi:hypothetical protein
VERPLFGGAGAQAFRPGSGFGYVNSYKKVTKSPKFFVQNLKSSSKQNLFVAFYFKEPFLVLKSMKFFLNHENF